MAPRCGESAALSSPELGGFSELSGGFGAQCASRPSGELICWGSVGRPPPGRFVQVDADDAHACAIDQQGRLACWGPFMGNHSAEPPAGKFVEVRVAGPLACARHPDGSVRCWSKGGEAEVVALPFPASQIAIAAVRSSTYHLLDAAMGGSGVSTTHALRLCIVGAQGESFCLAPGSTEAPFEPAPGRRLQKLVVSELLGCGTDESGALSCWHPDDHAAASFEPALPAGVRDLDLTTYRDDFRLCVLASDGRPQCWRGTAHERGRGESHGCGPPPGTFRRISVGFSHACALRDDGRVACWGVDGQGACTPP